MTVTEFYQQLSERIPASLSCEWDNDGLMVCPDGSRAVRRVLCTLDVTDEAVAYAEENGFDLILSHHPLIFKPLSSLTEEAPVPRKVIRLLQAGISVISLHTRADAVLGGVNDRLARMLGLSEIALFGDTLEMIGRIGELERPMPLSDFATWAKAVLGAPAVLVADANRPVRRVAVCGGDGRSFVDAAIRAGADTYVSGRIGYHEMTDAPERALNMIEAGHYFTETHITARFAELVAEITPEAGAEEFASNIIMCM